MYLQQSEHTVEQCDSDEEELLAETMFIDDLNSHRTLIHSTIQDCLNNAAASERAFAKEREFFIK